MAHAEIVDLRDDAVAHYGNGKSYAGEWQAEIAILVVKQGRGRVAGLGRRQVVDFSLCRRIELQAARARELLAAMSSEANNAVTVMLCDTQLMSEAIKHPLNLALFLGSHEAAEAVHRSNGVNSEMRGFIAGQANSSVPMS